MDGPRVVPAQLGFLAIYNPALGETDETFHQQIVFYHNKDNKDKDKDKDSDNEKLRQVGLAQGMVGFARAFSNGESVDSIETDKSRIVLHELEEGWWILASIALTQLPAKDKDKDGVGVVDYSSREVSPPALLVQQLVRAHALFTLHHGWPLAQLLHKHGRSKFCSILDTYWARFCAHWDVLLHASPAVEMFNGLKLAAGGELGMGVGEEEWGSSERDVLEDFARRTEGLVDVVVSRFGEAQPRDNDAPVTKNHNDDNDTPAEPWIGSRAHVAATDGVVFSGVGGLSRASLRDVAHWSESIYHYGDHAYGVRDNPTSDRRRRRRRDPNIKKKPESPPQDTDKDKDKDSAQPHDSGTGEAPRIPPPIVKAVESSLDRASRAVDGADPAKPESTMLASLGDTETWIKYMTLGYGSAWGKKTDPEEADTAPNTASHAASSTSPPRQPLQQPPPMRYVDPAPDLDLAEEKRKAQVRAENDGYFLVGLKGDMVEADMDDENDDGNWNVRIPLRTVYVEALNNPSSASESDETPGDESNPPSWKDGVTLEKTRLRPVVYVHRPFIYTFLFAHRTPSLTLASFYRSLHSFFAPLHASLDRNTAPSRVAQRLLLAQHPQATSSHPHNNTPIYDLVWDPRTLTLHTSLPNIPDPRRIAGAEHHWSRADALNVHTHLLTTLTSTRRRRAEIERTCKTARGWWVVWMRLPPSQPSPSDEPSNAPSNSKDLSTHHSGSVAFNTDELREAFLIRRARDADPLQGKSRSASSGVWSSLGMGMGMGMGSSSSTTTQEQRSGARTNGLAEGIGIDARRYVDELLSLNR